MDLDPVGPRFVQNPVAYEIGTKEIRYLAMASIAISAGVIATQGVLAATILTGVVILAGLAIQSEAESTFLDLNSQLSTAVHVELFIRSHFWGKVLLVSTLAGLTGTLAVAGTIAIMNEALLKGLVLNLLAWMGFAPFAQEGLASVVNLGNDASVLQERLFKLHSSLKEAPQVLHHLLLKHFVSDTTTEEFFQEIQTDAQQSGVPIETYFKFLLPVLTPDRIHRFSVGYPETINWDFLLTNLQPEQINEYAGKDAIASIQTKLAANVSLGQIFEILVSLRTFSFRLSNLPASNSDLHDLENSIKGLWLQVLSLLKSGLQGDEATIILARFEGSPTQVEDSDLQSLYDLLARPQPN